VGTALFECVIDGGEEDLLGGELVIGPVGDQFLEPYSQVRKVRNFSWSSLVNISPGLPVRRAGNGRPPWRSGAGGFGKDDSWCSGLLGKCSFK